MNMHAVIGTTMKAKSMKKKDVRRGVLSRAVRKILFCV
jgi:hypothetical protein